MPVIVVEPVIEMSPEHDKLVNKLVALNDVQLIALTVIGVMFDSTPCFSASELSMDVLVYVPLVFVLRANAVSISVLVYVDD